MREIDEGLRAQSQALRRPASNDLALWQAWTASVPATLATNGVWLEAALIGALGRSAAAGSQAAQEEIRAAGETVDVDEPDRDAIQQWAVEMGRQLGAEINATTATQIAGLVQQYQERAAEVEDEDQSALLDALWIAILALFGLTRADLISITETTRGLQRGWWETWQREIGTIKLEAEPPLHPRCRCWMRIQRRPGGGWEALWFTRSDERVCPLCGPLHEMEVGGTVRY